MCIHMFIYIYTHAYAYVCVYTYTYIRTYTERVCEFSDENGEMRGQVSRELRSRRASVTAQRMRSEPPSAS